MFSSKFVILLLSIAASAQLVTPNVISNPTSQSVGSRGISSSTVIAGGTLTFAHKWESSGCTGAGTTCPITTSAAIANGDFLVLQCSTSNAVVPVSMSGGGTLVDSYLRTGRSAYKDTLFYVPSATAFSAGTDTITFNAAPGLTHCVLTHATQTGSGLALDTTADWSSGTSTASLVQVPSVMTGTSGADFELADASNNPTHVTGITGTGWANSTAPNDETGAGSASAFSLSGNPTTPTVAFSGSNEASVNSGLFSFNPTASVQYGIDDFSASTNGTHPGADSVATLQAGMHGFTGLNQATNGVLQVAVTDAGSGLTYSTTAYKAFNTLPRFLNGGTTYAAPGTQIGLSWSSTAATGNAAKINYTPIASTFMPGSFVASEWIQFATGFLVTDTFNSDVLTMNTSTSDIATVNVATNGTQMNVTLEVNATCTNAGGLNIASSIGSWLEFDLVYVNGVKEEVVVKNAAGTTLGTLTTSVGGGCTLTGVPIGFSIGEALGGANTAGRTILFSPIKWGFWGNFTTEAPL